MIVVHTRVLMVCTRFSMLHLLYRAGIRASSSIRTVAIVHEDSRLWCEWTLRSARSSFVTLSKSVGRFTCIGCWWDDSAFSVSYR